MKPIFIVPLVLIAFFAVSLIIAWQLIQQKPEIKKISQSTPKELIISEKPAIEQKKIAYVKNRHLWKINIDGTNKVDLFESNSEISDIPAIAWKNNNDLSFISCTDICSINTISKSGQNQEANPGENAGPSQILTFAWNHAGDQLAYIYKLPDGQMRMDFKSGAVKNVVKTFASLTAGQGGRGGSLDDNVSIYFSPDDKYVLVTNTLGQPTVNDKSTIWAFESNGKEILNIESNTNSWATQAKWATSQVFIYKQGTMLLSKTLSKQSEDEERTISSNFYNPIFSVTKPNTIFWVDTQTLPYISSVPNGKPISKIIDGYYKPDRLGDFDLIALKAQKVPEGQETIFPYISKGLSKIDLRDNKVTDLDTGDINLFAVSP